MKLADLELKNPVMNASGICSCYPSLLKEWEEAGAGAVVTKSFGIDENPGNANPSVIEPYRGVILNCMKVPNPGHKEYLDEMKGYKFEVPVIYSLYGRNGREFVFLIKRAESQADAFELNTSCPHSDDGGYQIGFEPRLLRRVLQCARKATKKPISVKLPYYNADEGKLRAVVRIAEETGMDWITEINSLRAMDFSPEFNRPILSNAFGGQSGKSINFCAQYQVWATRKLTKMPIVACGGIENSSDAKKFLGEGADAVQIGSELLYYKSIKSFVKKVLLLP